MVGAELADRFHARLGRRPSCEPLGTFLAWLVRRRPEYLDQWTVPLSLRGVRGYPEARRLVRPTADGGTPAEAARLAAELIEQAQREAERRVIRLDRIAPRRKANGTEPP